MIDAKSQSMVIPSTGRHYMGMPKNYAETGSVQGAQYR